VRDPVAHFAPFGLVELSDTGIIVDANDLFSRWFFLFGPTIVGSRLADVFGIEQSELAEALRQASGGSDLIPATAVLRPAGAGARPLILAATRLENGNNAVAVVDASRNSDFEPGLDRPELTPLGESERLQLLLSASVRFANSATSTEMADVLADAARKSFRADWATVHLVDGDDFVLAGGHNPLAVKWPAGAAPTGARTMQLGRILLITDPAEAEEYLPGVGISGVFADSGVHSVLVAPITDHDVSLGTVACYFAKRRTFDNQAEPFIRALALQAGQVFTRLRLEEQLRRSTMLDDITGLPNRRLFERQFADASPSSAILFLDLDGFKAVNDELGHAMGDRLLELVAERLRGVFRHTDSVARYGGDEFVAIIEDTSTDNAMKVAERARAAIAETFPELPDHHRVTASIGVALDATGGGTVLPVQRLVRLADHAMYTAKGRGGNQAVFEYLR